MIGITCRDIRKIDFTFTAITRSQSSSLSSTTEARRMIPALLKSTSIAPSSRTVRSTTRWQSADRVTSACSKMARPPLRTISSATSCPAWLMSVTATAAPSRAKSKAAARPMPGGGAGDEGDLAGQGCMFTGGHTRMQLSARQPARGFGAVNRVHVAGHVRSVVRCQKCKQGRDFFRLGVPPQRNLAIDFVQHCIGVFGASAWG